MKKSCIRLFLIAALGPFVFLIGCNKPSGGSGGEGAIPVGEFASLTGKEAAFGNSSHKGTALAIEDLNAAGGVLGKKVNLIAEDARSTPGEAVPVVRKLISRSKVIAV